LDSYGQHAYKFKIITLNLIQETKRHRQIKTSTIIKRTNKLFHSNIKIPNEITMNQHKKFNTPWNAKVI